MSRGLHVPDAQDVIDNAAGTEVPVESIVAIIAGGFEASVRCAMDKRAATGRFTVSIVASQSGVNLAYAKVRDEARLKGYTFNSVQTWTRDQSTCHLKIDWSVQP